MPFGEALPKKSIRAWLLPLLSRVPLPAWVEPRLVPERLLSHQLPPKWQQLASGGDACVSELQWPP